MIDLRFALPTGIEVGGAFYELNTDFRVWLEFNRSVEEDGIAPFSIFKNEIPSGDWTAAALEFAKSENVTPRGGDSGERLLDLILDGDYITGAFWQVYGIDLTTASLHWHVFLALLRSLPDSCKLTEIMGYRGYTSSRQKPEQQYRELKKAWSLPPKKDTAILEWQEQAFGNIKFPQAGGADRE